MSDLDGRLDAGNSEELKQFLVEMHLGESHGLHTHTFIRDSQIPEETLDVIWLVDFAKNILPFDSVYWTEKAILS